jgi:hypothetical protein
MMPLGRTIMPEGPIKLPDASSPCRLSLRELRGKRDAMGAAGGSCFVTMTMLFIDLTAAFITFRRRQKYGTRATVSLCQTEPTAFVRGMLSHIVLALFQVFRQSSPLATVAQ